MKSNFFKKTILRCFKKKNEITMKILIASKKHKYSSKITAKQYIIFESINKQMLSE